MKRRNQVCEQCGKPLEDGKHPSMCNSGGKRRSTARRMRISKTCLGCGKQFELHYCHREQFYCSRRCMSNAKSVSVRCANCGQEFGSHDHATTNP